MRALVRLVNYGYETDKLIEYPFENIIYVIKNAQYFVGYQSGLSILADNYNIPQTMLYFNFLGDVMYSWPKNENIKNNIYNSFKFEDNIDYMKNFDIVN